MGASRKIVIRNKARGRAFQSKLARMVAGHNIGTLGGEDVMHEEFSYEAKTWDPKAKTHKGDWRGEKFMQEAEKILHPDEIHLVSVWADDTFADDRLVMLRFPDWEKFFDVEIRNPEFRWKEFFVAKFIGLTWMRQAEANCPDGKLPIVVVHTMGTRHNRDLVVLRKCYWDSLIQKEAT